MSTFSKVVLPSNDKRNYLILQSFLSHLKQLLPAPFSPTIHILESMEADISTFLNIYFSLLK